MATTTIKKDVPIDVSSKINITSTKGTISSKSAKRYGNLVALSFVFTASQSISDDYFGITATFTDASLKPLMRQPGSTNMRTVNSVNICSTASGADINAIGTLASGSAIWLVFLYMCS